MTSIETANAARKTANRTVIAHISDLHFTASTDHNRSEWQALAEDLARVKPDLIIATGDLIDSSLRDMFQASAIREAFRRVHAYLTETLCAGAGVNPDGGLLVVPGNHDYRPKGILFRTNALRAFRETFGSYFGHRYTPGLGLLTFAFDSNSSGFDINLASGVVSLSDLIDLQKALRLFETSGTHDLARVHRIAILHHHPMPVAIPPSDEFDREGFLLLKNSGLFMAAMIQAGVDLVLHGHKHYPGLSRASFFLDDEEKPPIVVLGAGSVGHADTTVLTYNLLTLTDEGAISIERRERREAAYRGFSLAPLEGYAHARQRRHRRLSAALPAGEALRVQRYCRYVRITAPDGRSIEDEVYEDVTSLGDDPVAEIRHQFKSDLGTLHDVTYTAHPPTQRVRFEWKGPSEAGVRLSSTTFDPPIRKNPVNLGRHREFANAFTFTKEDRLITTRGETDLENVSTESRHVYEHLHVQLSFPSGFLPLAPALQVFDEHGKRDLAEERYLAPWFLASPTGTISLNVPSPLPGYRYRVVWELPAAGAQVVGSYGADPLANFIKTRLLAGSAAFPAGYDDHWDALVSESATTLGSLLGFADGELQVCLFIEDQARYRITAVKCSGSTTAMPSVSLGQSIVGQALKRRKPLANGRMGGQLLGDQELFEPGTAHIETDEATQPPTALSFAFGAVPLLSDSQPVGIVYFRMKAYASRVADRTARDRLCGTMAELCQAWFDTRLLPALVRS